MPVPSLDPVSRPASGPVAVGIVLEVSLEDRFDHDLGGSLNHTITNGRNAERTLAQQPKAAFVAGLRPSQLPSRAACQLPDQSTIIRVRPSPTDSSRPRGARSIASVCRSADHFR